VVGRATQGVKLITLKDNDAIASVAKVDRDSDEEKLPENEVNGDQPETGEDNAEDNANNE
jgi:DNA gyrase subunit A